MKGFILRCAVTMSSVVRESTQRSRSASALACASSVFALISLACVQDSTSSSTDAADRGPPEDSSPRLRTDGSDEELRQTADGGPSSRADCSAALAEASFDFDAGEQGWTHEASDGATGTWPFDPWTWGSATAIACPAGKCWGAELRQNYAQCHRGALVSPRIDLSACVGRNVSLVLTHAYSFWKGSYGGQTWYDGGIVEISRDDGSSWQALTGSYPGAVKINPSRGAGYSCAFPSQFHVHGKDGFVGTQLEPSDFEVAIPSGFLTPTMRVRFAQASGMITETTDANQSRLSTATGWRIDNVRFTSK